MTEGEPNMRVLLVEDAPFLRYAFGRLLRLHGFEVREATDGREALDCVAEFQPQLVLTDLMMPVMDGIELIRRLHENPDTASLPVVAITADATEQADPPGPRGRRHRRHHQADRPAEPPGAAPHAPALLSRGRRAAGPPLVPRRVGSPVGARAQIG